ncbi:hypothetical protein SDJN03_23130, partial [Cucurbita argyrosperma subsp. sororia]
MMTRTHYPFVDGAASTAKKLKLETETWIKSLVFCRQRCRTKEECEDTIRRNLRKNKAAAAPNLMAQCQKEQQ